MIPHRPSLLPEDGPAAPQHRLSRPVSRGNWTERMNTAATADPRLAIVGHGRMGHALAEALGAAGFEVDGPLGHGPHELEQTSAVLLCVPDARIAEAAASVPPGPLVGHCSGALGLDVLAPHEAFGMHPLMTVTGSPAADPFRGAACAVA